MSKAKAVRVGVLLEDGPDRELFRDVISSNKQGLDYVIEPKSADAMFEFFRRMARENVRIKKLVLIGHGSSAAHHIGKLNPSDIDVRQIAKLRDMYGASCQRLGAEIRALKARLRSCSTTDRTDLRKEIKDKQDDYVQSRGEFTQYAEQLKKFREVSTVMGADAKVVLLNCYAASDVKGRAMMKQLARILLRKRGGTITGSTNKLEVESYWKLIWGYSHATVKPIRGIVTYRVKPSGERCGAPCKDFDRYGYCDRRAPDGGRCWSHG